MYGMINRGIEDLVVSIAGAAAWNQIKKNADLDLSEFLDSSQYNDDITYKLVQSASEVLELSPEEVLHAFGRHWILYTGREGWATVFDLAGDNMIDFINSLDAMHSRVQIALPEAQMPHFSVINRDDFFELTYRSPRAGLAPMVLGLLDGLAEQFKESWKVEHIENESREGCEIFHLRKVSSIQDTYSSNAA